MCHSRHHHHRSGIVPVADAPRRDPALRASDAERESAVTELREHAAAGRLDVEELEQRIGAAYAARTDGELAALRADLPAPVRARPAVRAPAGHGAMGHAWSSFFQVAFVLVAIWALAGAGYFWPAWVLVWWAVALLMRSRPRLLRPR
jgi:hypothetical protein